MVCFVSIVCLSIRKYCQRCDCSELGNIRNWVEHCISLQFRHSGHFQFNRGWSGGAMVLGKLPVPRRPAYLD